MGWTWDASTPTLDSSTATLDGGTGQLPSAPVAPSAPAVVLPATGSQADMVNRMQQLIPQGWFAVGEVPLRDSILTGMATGFAFIYSLLGYLRQQTRLATMTDGWLDMFAVDFFGNKIRRAFNQSDTSFKTTIQANLFRKRNTRAAVVSILQQITGYTPIVFEPENVADTGAYDTGTCCYDAVGGYGAKLPYQAFVVAFEPPGSSVANVAGYGIATGGYSIASQSEYIDPSTTVDQLTDGDIYDAINAVLPAAVKVWVRIAPGSSAPA